MYSNEVQDLVLESYKRVTSYASDAIAHYEHFMDHMMPYIIVKNSRVDVPSKDGAEKHVVQLRNIVVHRPSIDDSDPALRSLKTGQLDPLYPSEARARGLTYSAQILVDVEHSVYEMNEGKWELKGTPVVFKEMPLFEMPVMLRSKYCYTSLDLSGECWMDLGGYFIIRGNAKVIQPQKVQRINVHLVKGQKHNQVDMDIRSLRADEKFRSTSTLYMHLGGSPPVITVDIPFLKSGLPVICLFRFLGVHDQEQIEALLNHQDEANRRLFAANYSHPLAKSAFEDILDLAGSSLTVSDPSPEKIRRQVVQQVAGELLPHMGYDDSAHTRVKKLAYLSIIIRRMLDVYTGKADADDRDFEGYKSVQMSAGVLSVMFRQQFAAYMKMLRNRIYDRAKKGKHLDVSTLMSDGLTRDVLKAFSEGEVTVQKDASNAGTSVIQMAQQVNSLGIQTHIQRVSTALPRDGKYKQLRGVDPTQLFVFCPSETPEGHGCISLDATVLLSNGRTASMNEVTSKTLDVWTIDPITLNGSPSTIEKPFFRLSSGLGMYELETMSGRKIRATGDHPFLTRRGWIRADALDINEHVAIQYHPQHLEMSASQTVIIDAVSFKQSLTSIMNSAVQGKYCKPSRLDRYVKQLDSFFPLVAGDDRTLILARMCGYVATDGSLIVYNGIPNLSAFFGSEQGATQFCTDVCALGFKAGKIVERTTRVTDSTGRTAVHHTWRVQQGGPLGSLLIALGLSHGKKTESTTLPTPWWISNGAPIVQREWLAGLYGGDGGRPLVASRHNKPNAINIQIGDFVQHKDSAFVDSLVVFMEQTAAILHSFGIDSHVKKAIDTPRDKVSVVIGSSNSTVFRFLDVIGYRYDTHKQEAAARVREYLAYKLKKVQEREQFKEDVLDGTAHDRRVLEYAALVKRKTRTMAPADTLTWEAWVNMCPTTHVTTWVPLLFVRAVDDEMVADFTTTSSNHSFVANGFCTHNCGLLQNLATFAKVRVGTPLLVLAEAVLRLNHIRPFVTFADLCGSKLVFVNSDPIGCTDNEDVFVDEARKARRSQMLPFDCSIVRAEHGICISSDMGVVVFPLLYLPKMGEMAAALKQSNSSEELWHIMCRRGMVEYMDAYELLEYRVAFTPDTIEGCSHMAVHPSGFLGTSASSVPWPDHDQAPRVAYQAGMVKQAISTPAANVSDRMDLGYTYNLWYPQRPMADTAIARASKMNEWPLGENLIIAIAPYGGCSQEDSIIRNRGSVERGSGRVTTTRIFKATCRKRGTEQELFEHPFSQHEVKCEGIRGSVCYDKICADGLPEESIQMKNGDVIIGRVLHSTESIPTEHSSYPSDERQVRRDRSIVLQCEPTEVWVVDKVMVSITKEGHRMARVRLRSMRAPQEGDKISSRHGQKGTIGVLMNEEDLPFVMAGNNAGMRPDAIINLHSINGRMTIGKLLEMLFSSLGLVAGEFVDATPFRQVNARWAMDELMKSGYGTEEYMIDGCSGKMMERPWFIGSCFYQTLKHMVLDKITVRQRGQRAVLTRQPLDGRANQGGQRMGEMEKDAFLAHGAAYSLDDRSRIASDAHTALVCSKCGHIGDSKEETLRTIAQEADPCRVCGSADIVTLPTTYCYSRLLVPELATCGVKVVHKFNTLASSLEQMLID